MASNQLLQLTADEKFVRIESLATRPNLFRIVGRTYTETWHSMFLGWLLDPNGSHRLKDFSLKRLLVAITDPVIIGGQAELNRIARVASIGELDSAVVLPNEDQQTEYSCEAGKIDVFVEKIKCEKESDTVILIEQKVNAPISSLFQ